MNLKERIESNDNRGTAQPYLLLLQIKKTYIAHDDYGDDTKTRWVEQYTGDYVTADTEKELKEIIRGWHHDEEYVDFDPYQITKYQEGYFWETVNVFFTDEGYREHMKINGHNIGEHRTYGIHAFRNPEMKQVYDLIIKEPT